MPFAIPSHVTMNDSVQIGACSSFSVDYQFDLFFYVFVAVCPITIFVFMLCFLLSVAANPGSCVCFLIPTLTLAVLRLLFLRVTFAPFSAMVCLIP